MFSSWNEVGGSVPVFWSLVDVEVVVIGEDLELVANDNVCLESLASSSFNKALASSKVSYQVQNNWNVDYNFFLSHTYTHTHLSTYSSLKNFASGRFIRERVSWWMWPRIFINLQRRDLIYRGLL